MSKVLLTGSEGYLGAHVKRLLLDHGHSVVGVDTGWFSYPQVGKNRYSVGDLCGKEVGRLADVVIHLAWFSSAGNDLQGLQEFSLRETMKLVDLCKKTETRLIFASTASVYGFTEGQPYKSETDILNPVCAYGSNKLKAEQYIEENLPEGTYTIFRKGTLMGRGIEGGRTRLDLAVNAFIASGLSDGLAIQVWHPETVRPMYHVLDAAEAYVKAVEEDLDLCLINLAHKDYTILALAHRVADLLPLKPIVIVDFGVEDGSTRSYGLNCNRARQLGLPMDRGITWTVKEFLDPPFDFSLPTQRNVKWMNELIAMKSWMSSVSFPEDEKWTW